MRSVTIDIFHFVLYNWAMEVVNLNHNVGDFVEVDGIKFYKSTQGYWLGQVDGKPMRLHIYNYKKLFGNIPKGYVVHHIDHDPDNNDIGNLILVSRKEHGRVHHDEIKAASVDSIKKAQAAATEWHKSAAGREWHKQQYQNTLAEKWNDNVTKICEVCGKPFQSPSLVAYKSRFCSNNCKSQYRRNSGVDNIEVSCEICGAKFTTNKYARQRFCGAACRKEARLARNRNRKIQDVVV